MSDKIFRDLFLSISEAPPALRYFNDTERRLFYWRIVKSDFRRRYGLPHRKEDRKLWLDQAEAVIIAKECMLASGRIAEFGRPLMHPGGLEQWYLGKKAPRYDDQNNVIASIGIDRKITRHKQLKRPPERRRPRFYALTENSHLAVLTENEEGKAK